MFRKTTLNLFATVVLASCCALVNGSPNNYNRRATTVQNRANLDVKFKRQLDTFFSNFAEAEIPPFTPSSLNDRILIVFGVCHYAVNNPQFYKSLDPNGHGYQVPHASVDAAVRRYFGKTIHRHQAVRGWTGRDFEYRNGKYMTTWGDGAAQNVRAGNAAQ